MKPTDEQIRQECRLRHSHLPHIINELSTVRDIWEGGAKWCREQMQDNWIDVNERLPEIFLAVLICTDLGYITQGYIIRTNSESDIITWNEVYVGNQYCNITHWQPLPTPPKTKQP